MWSWHENQYISHYIVSLTLPETPSLPGKSSEVDSTRTGYVISFKYGDDEVVSWTTLDLPVGMFIAGVVDTIWNKNVLCRSTTLDLPVDIFIVTWDENVLLWSTTVDLAVVFFRTGVVDTNWDDNVLLSEAEYEDIVWLWNVWLCRVVEVFSILLENVVTSDSVEAFFADTSVDGFKTVTQSAGRWSLHLWILLSTTPFCFILAATQK